MTDMQKTLDSITLAIDDVRRAKPTSGAARLLMQDALGYLYMAEEAIRKAVYAESIPKTV